MLSNLSFKKTRFFRYPVLYFVFPLSLLVYLFAITIWLGQNFFLESISHDTHQGTYLSNSSLGMIQINGTTKPDFTSVKNVQQEVKDMIMASVPVLNSSANATSLVVEPERKTYVEFSDRNDVSTTIVWKDIVGGKATPPVGATQTELHLFSSHSETFSDFSHFERKPKIALPSWLEDYIIWHANTLRSLDITNWQSYRYLVARCLKSDKVCCGASDRLRSGPFLLRLANLQKRLLFYHWEQPAPLQSFLQPPAGGVNWTMPYWLLPYLNFSDASEIMKTKRADSLLQEITERSNQTLFDVRMHTGTGGAEVYNKMLDDNEPSFSEIFQGVWSILFEPSPPVARLIYQHMQDLGLQPGMYTSVHIRALYPTEINKNTTLTTQNAVKCANQLDPVAAIYVTSDIPAALATAYQFGQDYLEGRVKIRPTQITLHLDHKESTDPEQYYDTFVDLYLIAFSKCVAFGAGGFGRWGRDLSFNPSCSIRHNYATCKLIDTLGTKL